MHEFTQDQIRMLADIERRMANGEQPHVVWRGGRMAVQQEIMEAFDLVNGQDVSDFVSMLIMEAAVALIERKKNAH